MVLRPSSFQAKPHVPIVGTGYNHLPDKEEMVNGIEYMNLIHHGLRNIVDLYFQSIYNTRYTLVFFCRQVAPARFLLLGVYFMLVLPLL